MSQKGLKGEGLLLLSMESIPEVVVVKIIGCTSCKIIKGEGFFVKCACGPRVFFKTCKTCRDTKAKYREKVRASKAVSSSTTPADYFGPAPPR